MQRFPVANILGNNFRLGDEMVPGAERGRLEFLLARAQAEGDWEMARYYEYLLEQLPPASGWQPPTSNYPRWTKPVPGAGIIIGPPGMPPPEEPQPPPPMPTGGGITQRAPVESTMCPPGQFWDGRQCRGSVAYGSGGLISAAGVFGGGFSQMTTPFAMSGRTVPLVRGIGTRVFGY